MEPGEAEVLLSIEGLSRSFGSIKAVDDLSFEVRRGEIFGFLGPNGAGKTTTINMICGLLKPDNGTIHYGDLPIKEIVRRKKNLIGICPQELVLWDYLTCQEQLVFVAEIHDLARRQARRRAKELLARLGLEEKRKKTAKTLSGGLKRRLNLALALVHEPEIVILDEPEAGLDPQSRIMIREFIRSLARDKTVIFTTHNMDEAERLCDRVAIIDHGKLLVVDTPDDLKEKAGEGDIVEVNIEKKEVVSALEKEIKATLADKLKKFVVVDGRLIMRILDAARYLSTIMKILENNNIARKDTRFRWNSLEDVFINFTGRSLRE
jgi:ABC-2 type transport system ATP-binding protein